MVATSSTKFPHKIHTTPDGIPTHNSACSPFILGVQWCVSHEGVANVFHYLDDFAILGTPNSTECGEALYTLQKVAQELGIPLAADKQDGPTTEMVFLGIVIGMVQQELRLS